MIFELDERIKFWRAKERWPKDTSAFVFLGNVLETIGRKNFPLEWTGHESTTPELLNLTYNWGSTVGSLPLTFAKEWQKQKVYKLLQGTPDAPTYSSGSRYIAPKLEFSADQWSRGIRLADEIDQKTKPALDRWAKAKEIVVSAIADGTLISVLRPVAGGAFSDPLDRSLWYSERLESRFYYCQMSLAAPFGGGFAGDKFQYIFVSRESLDSWPAKGGSTRRENATGAGKGRPAAYDWASFEKQAWEKLEYQGAIDRSIDPSWTQARFEQEMADWALATWGKQPSESTIRDRLKPIIEEHREGRK